MSLLRAVKVLSAIAVVASLAAGRATAADEGAGPSLLEVLRRPVSLELERASIGEVLRLLAEQSGASLMADLSAWDRPVALAVREQPLGTVLTDLARLCGLHWQRGGSILLLSAARPAVQVEGGTYTLTEENALPAWKAFWDFYRSLTADQMAAVPARDSQAWTWPTQEEWETSRALRLSDLSPEQQALFETVLELQAPLWVERAAEALVMSVQDGGETWAMDVVFPGNAGIGLGAPKPGVHRLPEPRPAEEDD